MKFDLFSPFFEIVGSLCFLFAGSETFRAAVSETILQLTTYLDAIKHDLDQQAEKIFLAGAEKPDADVDRIHELAAAEQKFGRLKTEESVFRCFPEGMKSSFLMTGFFCLSFILLAGYAQFFTCAETELISLTFLNIVLLYNLVVFGFSYREARCGKDLHMAWPISLMTILLVCAFLYTSLMPWMAERCAQIIAFGQDQTGPVLPSSHVDIRVMISLSLLTSISPFIFHVFRVLQHKSYYKRKFEQLQTDFSEASKVADRVSEIIQGHAQARTEAAGAAIVSDPTAPLGGNGSPAAPPTADGNGSPAAPPPENFVPPLDNPPPVENVPIQPDPVPDKG